MSETRVSSTDAALLWGLSLGAAPAELDWRNADESPELHRWFHLHSDHPACGDVLRGLGLSGPVIDAMTAEETRPRVLPYDEGVLLILRGINANPGADPEDMVSFRIWISDKLAISARRRERQLLAARDTRDRLLAGEGPRTVAELLVQLIERIVDRIGHIVADFETQLDDIENDMQQTETKDVHLHLAETRRHIIEVRRYVAPQREALITLVNMKLPLLSSIDYMVREQTDRTTRYVEDLDLAREKALLLQEEMRNRIAEQQNQRMYVLSLVTAIFLPLSFLTGVFGMNVAGLPGTEDVSSFDYLTGFMLLVALGVLVWMKVRRWF